MFEGQDEDQLEAWLMERAVPDDAVRSQGVLTTDTRKAVDGYCGEIRYVDDELGRFFDRLRELGLWDESIVVVVSDHGEGLNQHSWASHGLVWDEQLRVPLIVYLPERLTRGARLPKRFEPLVSMIDLFPTLLGRMRPFRTPLAARFLEQSTGVDVLAPDFEPRAVFAQRTGREVAEDPGAMYALTSPDWKFISEESAPDRLFDRQADPHELVNLAGERTDLARLARAELEASMNEQSARGALFAEGVRTENDAELLRQMQELGYMGGSGEEGDEEADGDEHELPDR
jgi:arylsulfatase A-like enzyme